MKVFQKILSIAILKFYTKQTFDKNSKFGKEDLVQ